MSKALPAERGRSVRLGLVCVTDGRRLKTCRPKEAESRTSCRIKNTDAPGRRLNHAQHSWMQLYLRPDCNLRISAEHRVSAGLFPDARSGAVGGMISGDLGNAEQECEVQFFL